MVFSPHLRVLLITALACATTVHAEVLFDNLGTGDNIGYTVQVPMRWANRVPVGPAPTRITSVALDMVNAHNPDTPFTMEVCGSAPGDGAPANDCQPFTATAMAPSPGPTTFTGSYTAQASSQVWVIFADPNGPAGRGYRQVNRSSTGGHLCREYMGWRCYPQSWVMQLQGTLLPLATSASPATGLSNGGLAVRIAGARFTGATAVAFGGTPAASFSVDSDTQITAITPAHTLGPVAIEITTPDGTATLGAGFTFVAPIDGACGSAHNQPTSIAPTANLCSAGQASSVLLPPGDRTAYQWTCVGLHGGATSPQCSAPSLLPFITQANPSSAGSNGGERVTLTGHAFSGATAVTFGGAAAARFTVDSATQITATTPAHAAGLATIEVLTPHGTAQHTGFGFVQSVNGACGAAAGRPIITPPTADLCGAGPASPVQSAGGGYTWTCGGAQGGSDSGLCSAPWADVGTGKGSVQVDGSSGWRIQSAAFGSNLPAPLPTGARTTSAPLTLTLAGGTQGASVTVRYTQPVPPGATYLKYGPSPEGLGCTGATACALPHWYALPGAVFAPDGLSVSFTLTDGGAGDSDGAANGQITDPGLPVLLAVAPTGAQAIPALGPWALVLLSLFAAGMAPIRRRQSLLK
ncbi:IPTL-CTERM sorting domain-containing protein [Acidovorax sp. NB1]|uniref:IPTL-CTERM sorting domain-containing protein n=1 Tax=Acidovorax sp. NB1 TaxID=1943571 RepID=UPI0010E9A600|nr:IPTL-CTERM sorting domain-containing protein [Acidovorax sp. NB1]GDY36995.1 hypothetical protein ACINB_28870 [Acidovorax sp. NB1]